MATSSVGGCRAVASRPSFIEGFSRGTQPRDLARDSAPFVLGAGETLLLVSTGVRSRALRSFVLTSVAFAAGITACHPREPASPRDVLATYAHAIQSGNAHDAYALLSDDAKKSMPFEAFARMVKENP